MAALRCAPDRRVEKSRTKNCFLFFLLDFVLRTSLTHNENHSFTHSQAHAGEEGTLGDDLFHCEWLDDDAICGGCDVDGATRKILLSEDSLDFPRDRSITFVLHV